ncbi:MAG: hypothetical protein FK734_07430 [Asgard group archaeon]|nr:hypothetical protein [Asgard group archaeon]
MTDDISPTEPQIDAILSDVTEEEEHIKKFTFKSFLRMSGFTIVFSIISVILMVVGIILFYKIDTAVSQNAGFWIVLTGVVIFLLTVIFGFNKVDTGTI